MIAISGGKGFIGSALVKKLSKTGEIISIVKGRGLRENEAILEVGHEYPDLKDILNTVKIFIHTVGKAIGNQAELEHANIETTREFVNFLPTNLLQVIHLSSANVHFAEHNLYGQSKKYGEQIWKNSPFANRLLILRPTWIYGPGDHRNTLSLIANMDRYPFLPLPTTPIRPVYIMDFVDLVANLTVQPKLDSQIWTVSGAQITSLYDISRILATEIGKRTLLIPIPAFGLWLTYQVSKILGLQKLSERLYGFKIPKIWHDDAIWEMLPRELTPLELGFKQTITKLQAVNYEL